MNITIYKNPEGGYEFSGTRSDGQTIGGEGMDVVYATLIIHGKRTFESVPSVIKPRVKKALTDLGYPELAIEE